MSAAISSASVVDRSITSIWYIRCIQPQQHCPFISQCQDDLMMSDDEFANTSIFSAFDSIIQQHTHYITANLS